MKYLLKVLFELVVIVIGVAFAIAWLVKNGYL